MSARSRAALFATVLAALFSGLAGLGYEVVWARMLVVPLGNSADATALVLGAFMLGIAVGGWWIGRLADRVRSPLRLYAICEAILAGLAVIMPFAVTWLATRPELLGSLAERPRAAILRHLVFGLVVFLPALLMGGAVPALGRAVASREELGRKVGLIYGMNTLGGALGAAGAGFYALPALGLTTTSLVGALGSLLAAGLGLVAARLAHVEEIAPEQEPPRSRRYAAAGLTLAFGAGFVTLANEVVAARLLTFVFGHDTYAFASLLVVVLLGLGLGALLYRVLSSGEPGLVATRLAALFGPSLVVSFGAAALVTVHHGLDPLGLAGVGRLAASPFIELLRELAFTPLLVLLPAIVSGAAFPAAVALCGVEGGAGARVGAVALVNGLGAALGAIAAPLFLIGGLGLTRTVFALGAAAVLFGLPAALNAARRRDALVTIGVALLVLGAVVLALPRNLPRSMLLAAIGPRHQDLIYYEEGRTGTVAVAVNAVDGEQGLYVNAVNEVTTRLVHDQSFKLLGHLGPLLHPEPDKALMICLGGGLSAGAALTHPLRSLDVVELSPSVPRATRRFARENNHALDDPLLRLHLDDGRQYLRNSRESYDVVIVDSTHPKSVDSWILYTREFYALVLDHLADDGLVVQWVPLHGLSENEFRIIVRTFLDVFPAGTLWASTGVEAYGQAAYVKLVGGRKPLVIDWQELALRLKEPRIARDLAPFGMDDPFEVLDAFVAGPQALAAWTDGLPVQDDDRPVVPFITRWSAGRRMEAPLLLPVRSAVQSHVQGMGSKEREIRARLARAVEAQGFLLAGLLDPALAVYPEGRKLALYAAEAARTLPYYQALAARYTGDGIKTFEIASYLGNLGHPAAARKLYETVLAADEDDHRARLNLGLVLLDEGDGAGARREISRVVAAQPANGLARYDLGVVLLALGDLAGAHAALAAATRLLPEHEGVALTRAAVLIRMGRHEEARTMLLRLIEVNPRLAEAHDQLGLIAAARNELEDARRHHLDALGLDPYRAASHYNLGLVLQSGGRLAEAAGAFRAALSLEPRDAEAHNNLGLIHAAQGDYRAAALEHGAALEIDPAYAEAAYNLGLAERQLGNREEAIAAFRVALQIKPTLGEARARLEELGASPAMAPAPTPAP